MTMLIIEERIDRIAELHTKITEILNDLPVQLPKESLNKLIDIILKDKKLQELIKGIKERRVPRFMMVGCTGAGKSSLINALSGQYLAETSAVVAATTDTMKFQYTSHGKLIFEIIDTRGIGESVQNRDLSQDAESQLESAINEFAPDAILFVVPANIRAHIADDVKELSKIYQHTGNKVPLVGVVTKVDALEPADELYPDEYSPEKNNNIRKAVEQAKQILKEQNIAYIDVIPASSLIKWNKSLEGLSQFDRENLSIQKDYRYNIDELVRILEDNIDIKAAINLTLTYKVELAAKQIAERLTKIFAGIAGSCGALPIPVSDLPILCGLQALLVTIIAYLSGIDMTREAAVKFILSLGVIGITGFVLRAVVQQAGKFLNLIPGVGSVASGTTASLGTYSLGKTAIAYFMDGISRDKMDSVFKEAEEEYKKNNAL